MNEQVGWRALVRNLKREAPYWASTLPQVPRLVHKLLADDRVTRLEKALGALHAQGERRNRLIGALLAAIGVWLVAQLWALFRFL